MSTKSTILYRKGFHLYHELMEGDDVWLRLQDCEFEASPGSVTVRIPLAVWETIRTQRGFVPQYHDKSDQELLLLCTREVDERINEYATAPADHKGWAALFGSAVYGAVQEPREQQIQNGMESFKQRRAHEQAILKQIEELTRDEPQMEANEEP